VVIGREAANFAEQRKGHYDSFAIRVSQSGESIRDFKRRLIKCIGDSTKNKFIGVHSADGNVYDVIVQPDGLDSLGDFMCERKLGNPVAVIADKTVAGLYAEGALKSIASAGFDVHAITFLRAKIQKISIPL